MSITSVTNAFRERGYEVKSSGTSHTILHSERLARGVAAEIIAAEKCCPIMSQTRRMGLLQFTIVPYRKPDQFDELGCERKEMTSAELWSLVEATKTLAGREDSPVIIRGVQIFKTLAEGTLDRLHHCNLPSSLVMDYIYDAPDGGKALDVGCGIGANSMLLLKKGWKVVALDKAPEALSLFRKAISKEEAEHRVTFVNSDVAEYEISPSSANLVVCVDVLPYIPSSQLRIVLEKIHTALVPNGTFIGTLFISPPETEGSHKELMSKCGAYLYPDSSIARAVLESTGFNVEECSLREESKAELQCVQFRAKKTV